MYNLNHIIKKITGAGKALLLVTLLLATGAVWAQNTQTLKGRIVDTEGNPIAGAVVNVAEESRIVLSDENGYFSLKNVRASDEICISSVGYKNAQVAVDFNEGFKIELESDLDEYLHTTPIAFGRKAKKLVTESTSVVTGEELQKHPITVLQNAFTSTVTGMETYEWSSEPGWTETAMYIRGIRTMNTGARAPLVIVDNMERDLSFLDAFPIENITILKDAAATAIYGMRGANGAILVTTKRGSAGKTNIDFTQEVGFQMLSNKMENQNSYNMALTRNRVKYLDGQTNKLKCTAAYATEKHWKVSTNTDTSIPVGPTNFIAKQLLCTRLTCKSVVVTNVPAIMFHSLTSVRKACGMTSGLIIIRIIIPAIR